MAGEMNFCFFALVSVVSLYGVASVGSANEGLKSTTLKINENGQIVSECGDEWADQLVMKALCDDGNKENVPKESVCHLSQCIQIGVKNTAVRAAAVGRELCRSGHNPDKVQIMVVPKLLEHGQYKLLVSMLAQYPSLEVMYKRVPCDHNNHGSTSSTVTNGH